MCLNGVLMKFFSLVIVFLFMCLVMKVRLLLCLFSMVWNRYFRNFLVRCVFLVRLVKVIFGLII